MMTTMTNLKQHEPWFDKESKNIWSKEVDKTAVVAESKSNGDNMSM
jgi:hypothetical protein